MKNINLYLASFLVLVMLISSCEHPSVQMYTVIHEDGTCTSELSYRNTMTKELRDSIWGKDSIGWSHPLPKYIAVDSMLFSRTDIEADTVTTTLARTYHSVEEMSEHTPLQINGIPLKSKAKLEKRFCWFYTEYTFTQTFDCLEDRFVVSPNRIGDKEMVRYWFTGSPNLMEGLTGSEVADEIKKIESSVNRWVNENIVEIVFASIANQYDSIINPPLTKDEFLGTQDSFFKHLSENRQDMVLGDAKDLFYKYYHSDAYALFLDGESVCGREVEKKLFDYLSIMTFKMSYYVKMPGRICGGTNVAFSEKDEAACFQLTSERLIPNDYTVSVSTRVTCAWAVVVSIFVVLTAVISLVWRKKRR